MKRLLLLLLTALAICPAQIAVVVSEGLTCSGRSLPDFDTPLSIRDEVKQNSPLTVSLNTL